MDQANLGKPVFKAEPETSDDDDTINSLSFATIAKVKVMAGRARRRSLFDYDERDEVDVGQSTVSHAHFPASPPRSRASSIEHNISGGFDKNLLYEILEQEMTRKLTGKYYDNFECDFYSKQIVSAVKDRIAALDIKNFKIVCVCYITKRAPQAMKLESGCAWDELTVAVDKDSFVDCVFQNEFISALGSIYGVCCQRVPHKPASRSSSFPARNRRASMIESRLKH